jgi:hypothetical protein
MLAGEPIVTVLITLPPGGALLTAAANTIEPLAPAQTSN